MAQAEIQSRLDKNEKGNVSSDDYKFEQDDYQAPEQETYSTPSMESQFYANLELTEGASFEEVKKAYKTLMKKYHPDKHHGDPIKTEVAEEITKKLNEAYNYFENKHKNN